jgi:hypothetical protein
MGLTDQVLQVADHLSDRLVEVLVTVPLQHGNLDMPNECPQHRACPRIPDGLSKAPSSGIFSPESQRLNPPRR